MIPNVKKKLRVVKNRGSIRKVNENAVSDWVCPSYPKFVGFRSHVLHLPKIMSSTHAAFLPSGELECPA